MKLWNTVLCTFAANQLVQALVIPELNDIIPLNKDKNSHYTDVINKKGADKEPLDDNEQTKLFIQDNKDNLIPNKYIIIFKDNITPDQINFHMEFIQQLTLQQLDILSSDDLQQFTASIPSFHKPGIIDKFHIDNLLNGYIGYFNKFIVDKLSKNPLIKSIEQDSIVHINDFDTQNNAPWGLARISHRDPLNLGSFNKYLYDDDAGAGVDAYIIDTGVNINHNDFDKRATWGKTIPLNDFDEDGNGHGTHCAGTIGSKTYGVAKNANLIAVKVLKSNGSGSMSDVIKGVEFAAKSHIQKMAEAKNSKDSTFKGSTANMSLGGGKSPSLDMVVNAAVRAGIHFAVAAGNENQNACNTSPASAELAVCVGASTLSDDRAYFSNWGECVDIFAPGLNILSTYIGSNDATATLSGTSMASPHVAGLLTYFLSLQPEKSSQFESMVTPEQLKKKLIDYSTKNVLFDLPEGTPNSLIFNGAGARDFWNDTSNTKESNKINDHQLLDPTRLINLDNSILYQNLRNLWGKHFN